MSLLAEARRRGPGLAVAEDDHVRRLSDQTGKQLGATKLEMIL